MKIDRLAVETGVWPLKESVNGRVTHTYIPRKRPPVENYLKTQRRFEHLFGACGSEHTLQEIQRDVDEYWRSISI